MPIAFPKIILDKLPKNCWPFLPMASERESRVRARERERDRERERERQRDREKMEEERR